MTNVLSFAEARDAIAEIITSRNVVLVIGAGASVTSGAPVTSELVRMLSKAFPNADIEDGAGLFDCCRDVELTPAYGRQALHEFVRDVLGRLAPSESYKQLPRVRWRGLFTTNYDDLIEKAYLRADRKQGLQAVPEEFRAAFIPRDNHVALHYLMGSVKYPYSSASAPVLTWGDYARSLQHRADVLMLFKNLLADGGKVIYVGYSFGDMVFETVLDEVIQELGPRSASYGYAVIRDWPEDKQRGYHRIAERKVIPVDGTFEQLAALLQDLADGGLAAQRDLLAPPPEAGNGLVVVATGNRLTLNESEAGVYSESLEIVHEGVRFAPTLSESQRIALGRAFFRGEIMTWVPYALGLPFKRGAYDGVLAAVLERALNRGTDDPTILIHGPAALGKSVMARQLAFDLYATHGLPVVLIKPGWRSRPDFKLLDRLIDDLETQLAPDQQLPPIVIIADEAELLEPTIIPRVVSYLRARQRRAVIALFARTNEFFRLGKGEQHSSQAIGKFIGLSDRIEPPEVAALIQHLVAKGLWDSRRITVESFWQEQVATKWDSAFFDTIYSLIEDTQIPLREQVWSEFHKLSETAQRAYMLIASVYQFGIPLKMEILMRALAVSFSTFEEEVIRSDARDVLFTDHVGGELNVQYRGRTRLISQLVFTRALPTPGAQLPIFMDFVKAVNPNEVFGLDELDTLRSLLVQVLGPAGFDNRFSPDEQAELFEAATRVIQDDVLEHHFGIVEKTAGRLLSARKHLEKALELSTTLPRDLSTLREAPQNIENTLALVLGMLAQEAIRRGDKTAAEGLFVEAGQHFLQARSGIFPNAAAYDAHARMLVARADRLFVRGSAEHVRALVDALDVLNDGIDSVNDDHRPGLVELQAEVLSQIEDRAEAIADLAKRASNATPVDAARYEIALARLLVGAVPAEAKRKRQHQAMVHAARACELDASYFSGWKLRAELHRLLHPADREDFIKLLETASRLMEANDNPWVLYELGVAYFDKEAYEQSASTFRKLRRATSGNRRTAGTIEVAGERNGGEPYEFEGRVARGERRSGYFIQCHDLTAFGDIYFNTRAERFYTPRLGDRVSFSVGFNYRGVLAIDVKRV